MQIEMTHQGADGRPDYEHADRDPARQGRSEGAADLGRHLRSQRHRAADREHRDAAADDPRSAAQRHPRSRRPKCRRSSSAICRRTRSTRSSTSTLNGETVAIDARPSDAIALALRTRAPIFVEDAVIDNAKTVDFTTGESRLRSPAQVAGEPRPRRPRQIQDVGAQAADRPAQAYRRPLLNLSC